MHKREVALITGITGMVGSHLADFLIKNTDWDIVGMCRWRSPQGNVSHLYERANRNDRIRFIEGDLLDETSLISVLRDSKPDYVFHLAAQSYPTASFTSPISTLNTNILGTARLLEAVRLLGIDPKIHVCSSSEVFGRVSQEDLPISEDAPFKPASPYSISKVGTDLLSSFYFQAYGLKTIATRMFTHTGPRRGEVFAESTFAKQIALAEKGLISPVIKVGNLNSLRTWSDVRDAVRAYHLLLTKNPKFGEVYNIGGTFSATVGDMLNKLISLSPIQDKLEIEVVSSRIRPLDADLQIPDTTKFNKHTGWVPEITFEQTMQDLLDYWRKQVSLSNFLVEK
jgi:GDPmannose 4,6-dehydratase